MSAWNQRDSIQYDVQTKNPPPEYWQQRAQYTSPTHKSEFLKWAAKQYGGQYDFGYYATGKRNPNLIDPGTVKDEQGIPLYYKVKAQFDYGGGKKQYAAPDIDPYRADPIEIDAMDSYLKDNGYNQFDQSKYQQYYNKLKYKGQYGNTVEDKANEEAGLPPLKAQYSQKLVNEYNALTKAALAGNLSYEKARQLAPSLYEVTEYTKDQAAKKAAAETGTPERSWSFQGTKAAADNGLDPEVLKALGYDANTGFANLFEGLPQTGTDIMEAQNMYRPVKYSSLANPGMPAARPITARSGEDVLNAGIMAGVPQQAQPADPLKQTGNFWQDLGQNFSTGMQMYNTEKRQNDTGAITNTFNEFVAKPLSAAKTAYLNVLGAGLNAATGKQQEFTPNMTLADWSKRVANATGKDTSTMEDIATVPVLGAVANFSLEILSDPLSYVAGGPVYDALKAKGLDNPKNIEYVQAFVKEKLMGQEAKAAPVAELNAMEAQQARAASEELAQRQRNLELGAFPGKVEQQPAIYVPPGKPTAEVKPITTPYDNAGQAWGNLGKPRALTGNAATPAAAGAQTGVRARATYDTAPIQWSKATENRETVLISDNGRLTIRSGYGENPRLYRDGQYVDSFGNEAQAQAAAQQIKNNTAVFPEGTPSMGVGPARPPNQTPAQALAERTLGPAKSAQTTTRTAAQEAAGAAETSGKATAAKPIGTQGQSAYDLQGPLPEGLKERGVSENIRTDTASPSALRQDMANNPLTYKQLGNKDTLAKATKVYDETVGKGDLEGGITQLNDLTERMKPEAAPLAKLIARKLVEDGNIERARAVIAQVAEKATEAGQYGQAFAILRDADPESMILSFERQFKKLNELGRKVYGKKWKDFDFTQEELGRIRNITPGDQAEFEAIDKAIKARVADQMPSTALEKATAWRHMAMLLNPKTHLRNILGNAAMTALNKASNKASALLQKLLPRDLRTQAVVVRKESANLAKEVYASHESELMTGGNKYNEGLGLNMPDKRTFKSNALESVKKFNYKALDVEDKWFYKRAYIDRLASALQVRGIKSAADIPQDILQLAAKEAEKAVFRDKNALVSAIGKLKQSKAGFVADTVMPFSKTPVNIARRGLDYSPVGIGKGIKKLFNKETIAEGMDDIAKGLTGVGVMGAGFLLAENGILTGPASSNQKMAAYDKASGVSPFSVLGVESYDWAQPFAIPLAVGVSIYESLQQDPRAAAKMRKAIEAGDAATMQQLAGFYGQALLDGFVAAGNTMYNMSVMQGIQDLLGNPQGVAAGILDLPANYVNQFIPTALGQVARTIDPTVRQTNYGYSPVSNPLGYIKTQAATVASKIPGVSTALAPRVTPFGQEQTGVQNPWLRALQQFVNPGNLATPQEIDPQVDTEIRRLYDNGQINQFPITVERSFNFMGKAVNLTDAEYAQYQRDTGQETISAMKDIINDADYRKIPAKELTTKLKALAAQRGVSVESLRRDSAVIDRLTEEYKAGLLSDGIVYARSLAQLEILKQRGLLGNPTDKELADRMGIPLGTAKKIN